MPAPAATLFEEAHGPDHHRPIDGLEHVVERQRGHAHCRQRFHLDPGAVGAAHRRRDADLGLADLEVDVDPRKRQLMAQRDQVAGVFGRQDACHPRGGERITLG